jgi:hypothetical protein
MAGFERSFLVWPSAMLSFKALTSGYFAATCGSLAFALQERRKNPAAEDRARAIARFHLSCGAYFLRAFFNGLV